MKHLKTVIPANCKIVLAGDLHIGALNFSKSAFADMVSKVKRGKNTYLIGMGDYLEAKEPADPHFEIRATDKNMNQFAAQMEYFYNAIKPIASKVIGLLRGNHEDKIERKVGNLLETFVCKPLSIPYAGYSCIHVFTDKRGSVKFKFFLHHGFGFLNSNAKDPDQELANMKAGLRKKLKNKAGDCVVKAMGHTHKLIVAEPHREKLFMLEEQGKTVSGYSPVKMVPHPGEALDPDMTWAVNTGTFRKLHNDFGEDDYSEKAGYDPVDIGYAVVHINDYKVTRVERVVV